MRIAGKLASRLGSYYLCGSSAEWKEDLQMDDLEAVLAKARKRDEREPVLRKEIVSGKQIYDLMGFDQKLRDKGMKEIEWTYQASHSLGKPR